MIILELACLGLRSFRQITKLALKSGLNLIYGRTGSGKTTLFDCLQVTLFGLPAQQVGLTATAGNGPVQAAVTVKLRSGEIYRVITDVAKDAFQILRWDQTGRAFAPVGSDPGALARIWQPECGGLSLSEVRDFVAWSPRTAQAISTSPEPPGFASEPAAPPAVLTPDERAAKIARLAELQTALVRAERVAQSADDRRAAAEREAQIRNRLAALDALAARREEWAARKEEMAPFLQGPKDLDTQIDGYIKAIPALAEERTMIEDEITALAAQIEAMGAAPLLKTPLFWAGAGLTAISFLVGFVKTTWEWLPSLYVVGLAAGLALLVASLILDFRRLGNKRAMEARHAELQKKASRLEDRLKKTYATPIALMAQTQCADPETLKAKRRAAREWSAEQERFDQEEATILGGKGRIDLEEEWRAAKARVEHLTREAGEEVDVESLRDAIRHLTQELDHAPAPLAATAGVVAAAPRNGSPSPVRDHAADIAGCLARLTDARLEAVSQRDGRLCVTRRGASDAVPVDLLSSGEALQTRVAIALGAWVARRNTLGFPLILDDPLSALDPQSRRTLIQIMTAAAANRQIIVFTTAPVPETAGIVQTALNPA